MPRVRHVSFYWQQGLLWASHALVWPWSQRLTFRRWLISVPGIVRCLGRSEWLVALRLGHVLTSLKYLSDRWKVRGYRWKVRQSCSVIQLQVKGYRWKVRQSCSVIQSTQAALSFFSTFIFYFVKLYSLYKIWKKYKNVKNGGRKKITHKLNKPEAVIVNFLAYFCPIFFSSTRFKIPNLLPSA